MNIWYDDHRPAGIQPDEFETALVCMVWLLFFIVFEVLAIRWAVDQASLSWAWIAAGL